MKVLIFIFRLVLILAAAGLITTLIINIAMVKSMEKYIYTDINDIPFRATVMVLGAQTRGTTLSPVLRDRVNGGIALMRAGKGDKLLLSGDHGQLYYDEVNAMRLYVLDNAPEILHEDIFMDHAGFNTWDSMYRARDVFEVKELLIVTQEFHISRAVCMARSLGIDAVGYGLTEDHFGKINLQAWRTREFLARIKAVYSIIFNIQPKYLGDIIPISGDGRATWI
ncbi:MAG: YdcF family protein [Treponema sp.]|nr:YdcF family protein [Treponema sp.]